jgi:hypothetical protein
MLSFNIFPAILLCISTALSGGNPNPTPAFPTAEGFGKWATGGRGGQVVAVTNINDSGEGSLRWALDKYPDQPITVVFNVSGIIDLKTDIRIKRSNVTIAGQTASGDGICLKSHSLRINGASGRAGGNHGNIIIRYLRSRPGGKDKSGLYGIDVENCHDVMIDHCSFSWANEENAALYDTKNLTIQWCISSEGLYEAGHAKGHRSYSGVWGGQRSTFHHNLIANNNSRTVRFNGARAHDTTALIDYRNNVIFNWSAPNACYGGEVEISNGKSMINMVNNYYLPGPATPKELKFIKANYTPEKAKGVGTWYVNGNVMRGSQALNNDNSNGVDAKEVPADKQKDIFVSAPFAVTDAVALQPADKALETVLANAGATLPKRDATDERLVKEAKTNQCLGMGVLGKPGIIDDPSAVGGWAKYQSKAPEKDTDGDGIPDSWETKNQLNPRNAKDGNKLNTEGYTMLEVYLNSLTK